MNHAVASRQVIKSVTTLTLLTLLTLFDNSARIVEPDVLRPSSNRWLSGMPRLMFHRRSYKAGSLSWFSFRRKAQAMSTWERKKAAELLSAAFIKSWLPTVDNLRNLFMRPAPECSVSYDRPASLINSYEVNATQRLVLLVPSSSQTCCNPNQTAAQKHQRCWLRYGLVTYPTTLPTL